MVSIWQRISGGPDQAVSGADELDGRPERGGALGPPERAGRARRLSWPPGWSTNDKWALTRTIARIPEMVSARDLIRCP